MPNNSNFNNNSNRKKTTGPKIKRRKPKRNKALMLSIGLSAILFVLAIALFLGGDKEDKPQGSSQQSNSSSQSESQPPVNTDNEQTYSGVSAQPSGEQQGPAKPNEGDTLLPPSDDIPRNEWYMVIANKNNPLPADYAVETVQLSNGLYFSAKAVDDLDAMIKAGRSAGYDFIVCSAYRTVEKQTNLFNAKVNELMRTEGLSKEAATEKAGTIVAVPGTSEHNTGLSADIVITEYQNLDDGYGETEAAKWMMANAADYGFILRYPKGKEDVTGIIYEPWHYRYVGKEQAKLIKASGKCLEEYLGVY